jgi:UDP-N-acetylglucosamine acyltransferase
MSRNEVIIHPTSTVHAKAQLEAGIFVGPQCVIGEKVTIHKNTRLSSNVHIDGRVEIGEGCQFSPYSVIGTGPQDVGYRQEETCVRIGDRNIFREFITIHRGTEKGGGETVIGHDNYFMAYAHVGHDCRVGNGTILTNAATLGGHVSVDDFAYLSAFCGVHQFCRIGKYAFVGGFTVVTQDVLPFCRVAGMRPVLFYGLNSIGLRRKGFSRERISALKEIFKLIFYSDLNTTQALEKITTLLPPHEDREEIVRFIQSAKRGIIKKAAPQWEDESES